MAEIIELFKLQKGVNTMLDMRTIGEEKAQEVLQAYTSQDEPINPIAIAEKLGIKVINAEFTTDMISGALQVHPGDDSRVATIYVKHDDAPVRKRFTIAHELGHYFLHAESQTDFIDEQSVFFRNGQKNKEETEANDFAANLLMPRELVLKIWGMSGDVEFLSHYFGVSRTAMKYRLNNLGVSV
ncbi:ImmA/IrrE family metallo-endopeptidase [Bacillus sp. GM2]|uniref:ImmA/IrrE family metallo-endopeptidase n=1 Tax=Bacillus TaxID=1386 RepID=UPI00069EDF18|nr:MULTISPECIES: ImmA/IrrE family metallo-endopeptidase [Bacillus subtilis group]KRT92194.1 hypothetical protein ACH97_211795 [Bacillus paralicheniformis]MBU8759278.1 ImmA/IrrE family metallo-endopeptidase [Bacillus paralicheniformis]MBZ5213394.1 ImmA/IrrE family metallo-endopeptidase [Bacillus paralicheniformis]MEC1867904.1 ImmA/IrrE family metallo-endopeptidase [Bacillus paralicheniformis]OMI09324.1 ImmA/IrrE family metallo-endopeptidase [Bacillus paralicheniformis]